MLGQQLPFCGTPVVPARWLVRGEWRGERATEEKEKSQKVSKHDASPAASGLGTANYSRTTLPGRWQFVR